LPPTAFRPSSLERFAAAGVVSLLVASLGCSPSFKGRCQTDADCGYGQVCDATSGERLCKAACGDLACTKISIRSVPVTDAPAATNGFYAADGGVPIPVSVVVADGVGMPAASAELAVNGVTLAAMGPPTLSGSTRTFAFQVPASLGVPGAEAPLGFTVTAKDVAGSSVVATIPGRLKIDDLGPSAANLAALTAPQFTDTSGVHWYRQSLGGAVEVTASVTDAGSGVNPSSLRLVLQSDGTTRVDSGAVAGPDSGTTTYHFFIPRLGGSPGQIAAGAQGLIQFQVSGADNLGHPLHLTAAGQIGIDGQAPAKPTLDFTGQYPPASGQGSGCSAGAGPGTLLCGHDGAHFWRLGDDNKSLAFSATDGAGGSGLDTAAGSTCDFGTGQPACAVQHPGGSGGGAVTYHFTINPSQLNLLTDPAGNAQVSVTVAVRDAVGNVSPSASAPLSVTRVKWVRQFGAALSSLTTAPILTPPIGATNPQRQLIIAGAGTASPNDSIYSLGLDGAVLGSAGHAASPPITSVSSAMAFSASTKTLFALTNSSSVYVFPVSNSGPTALPSVCNLGPTASSSGSPVLVGFPSLPEVAIVADAGNGRVQVISGTGGCSITTNLLVTTISNVLGSPTTDGAPLSANIYLPSGGADIAHLTWDGMRLTLLTHTIVNLNAITGVLPVGTGLFFGDDNKNFASFTTSFTSRWTGPSLAAPIAAGPIIHDGYLYGLASAVDGQLHVLDVSTGAQSWQFPSDTTKIGSISVPVIGGSNTVYFTDSANRELVAVQYSKVPSATTAKVWAFNGESNFRGADTRFTGGGAEPVIGADGTLYFVDGSSVYAIMTDTGAGATPAGGTNWPRVAFDNCNSGNSSYTNCQ
jgi:hypothetical protein